MPCRWFSMEKSMDDMKSPLFWRAVAAETLGTGFLVFFAAGASMGWDEPRPSVVQLSLTAGLAVSTILSCIASISGAHINPAVTLPMWISRQISAARALLYILGQTAGAVGGAAVIHALTPADKRGFHGMNRVHEDVSAGQAVGIEFVITFILVFTVYAVLDKNRAGHGGSIPLAVGLSVVIGHLTGVRYTGACMNPSRAFGPALMHNNWEKHWVYWVGPNLGGIAAGLIYDFVFAANASIGKAKGAMLKLKRPVSKQLADDIELPLKDGEAA